MFDEKPKMVDDPNKLGKKVSGRVSEGWYGRIPSDSQ
jgi:hypothetical protein